MRNHETNQDRERVVVVTGASAGVGRAVAGEFARRGSRVALLARGETGLDGAVEEVERAGGRALALAVDVADAAAVDEAASKVEDVLGPVDVWVNDAMATVFAPVWEVTPAEFERATRVTYLGAVHGTMAALERMRSRDRGTIVQVGSALAYRAIPLQSAYCGAKFALRGFTDSLRTELMHESSHIRVSMVQLPAVNTPQFDWSLAKVSDHPQPVPPIYQPEVAARAVAWAADHDRREVWVAPSAVGTILANKVAPGLLDRYLARTGFASQQTDDPLDPDRDHNLWAPVDAADDHGAHGPFDDRARDRSIGFEVGLRWRSIAAGTASVLAAVGLGLLRRSRDG